ncbi:MAG: hypothetical protein KF773_34270 [Deltaproteobacteria bacterium]|nr:hypothetical protein [Deltaproteobacteria bacterium]
MTTSRPTGRMACVAAGPSSIEKALATAAFNVLVIAAALAATAPSSHRGDLFVFSLVVGLTPGLTAGVLLGWLAGHLTRFRLLALTTLSFAILALTAVAASSHTLVLYGSVPLLASVALLERSTRSLR